MGRLRQRLREARRTRLALLAAFVIVMLGILPAFMVLRQSSQDPVFAGLDGLSVPSWAALSHEDQSTGSDWCTGMCRLRERTWRSSKGAKDTDPVYQQALRQAGWQPWASSGCPKSSTGSYSCWRRDQYVLDLSTRDAPCDLNNVAPVPSTGPSGQAPSGTASGGPTDVPLPTPTGTEAPPTCQGALVTAKIGEAIDPNWHK